LIRLYSDKKYSRSGLHHHPLLFPFWGIPEHLKNDERFINFTRIGPSYFELSSLEDADYALFPTYYQWICDDPVGLRDLDSFLKETERYSLKTIIFFTSDSSMPLQVDNAVIFRNSLLRSKQNKNEYSIPHVVDDILQQYCGGQLHPIEKEKIPRIGFVGYAATPIRAFLSRMYHGVVKKPCNKGEVSTIRYDTLKYLTRTSKIASNVILRRTYWGTLSQTAIRAEQRKEFIQNMLQNDYILCARGGGNFSFRLYETLCCGRIPLFINTECVLPCENIIDWKKYVVWVEEKDIANVENILLAFHEKLSDPEYLLRQAECRKLWEDYFSVEGFLNHLHGFLTDLKQ